MSRRGPVRLSVVVCTYQRPNELRRLLRSIRKQTLCPDEVLVVDASEGAQPASENGIIVIPAARGLTLQRNIGAKAARGDIVVFVDDDAVMVPTWLESIQRAFLEPDNADVGGVTGPMLPVRTRTGRQRGLGLAARLFGLGEVAGSGRFKLSGFPSLPSGPLPLETETLFGGLMGFRRSVLLDVGGFDENLTGYAYMEDQDIAARLRARGWRLLYLPQAGFYHLPPSPPSRTTDRSAAMKVLNSRYLLRKNFRRSLLRELAWWWAMVGLEFVETRAHGLRGLGDVARGLMMCLIGTRRRVS